jgi:hypothetical protein
MQAADEQMYMAKKRGTGSLACSSNGSSLDVISLVIQ